MDIRVECCESSRRIVMALVFVRIYWEASVDDIEFDIITHKDNNAPPCFLGLSLRLVI